MAGNLGLPHYSSFIRGTFGIGPATPEEIGQKYAARFGMRYQPQYERIARGNQQIQNPLTGTYQAGERRLNALEKGQVFGQQMLPGQTRMVSGKLTEQSRNKLQEIQRLVSAGAQAFEGMEGPITTAIQQYGQDIQKAQGGRGIFGQASAVAGAAGQAGFQTQFQNQLLPSLREAAGSINAFQRLQRARAKTTGPRRVQFGFGRFAG